MGEKRFCQQVQEVELAVADGLDVADESTLAPGSLRRRGYLQH